jgi:hypothetical protein
MKQFLLYLKNKLKDWKETNINLIKEVYLIMEELI